MRKGPAKNGYAADQKRQVVYHLRGKNGQAIEIRRPGTLFSEFASSDNAPTIEVLGTERPGFGPISPGGDRFIVFFTYPESAGPRQKCATFTLNEIAVPLEELKKVAEGLRRKD